MTIQRLRINGWDITDCDKIVKFNRPDTYDLTWEFYYENEDVLLAFGQVVFLLKAEKEKVLDTGETV